MFPNNATKIVDSAAELLPPYNITKSNPIVDRELGPSAVNNISDGLMARTWICQYNPTSGDVSLDDGTFLFNAPNLTELSFTFDQAGRPFVAFSDVGVLKIWWYNPTVSAITITEIGDGYSPLCRLDERRNELVGSSDIILIHKSSSGIKYRYQRDRFVVEYSTPISNPESVEILNFGMDAGNRMQVKYVNK